MSENSQETYTTYSMLKGRHVYLRRSLDICLSAILVLKHVPRSVDNSGLKASFEYMARSRFDSFNRFQSGDINQAFVIRHVLPTTCSDLIPTSSACHRVPPQCSTLFHVPCSLFSKPLPAEAAQRGSRERESEQKKTRGNWAGSRHKFAREYVEAPLAISPLRLKKKIKIPEKVKSQIVPFLSMYLLKIKFHVPHEMRKKAVLL